MQHAMTVKLRHAARSTNARAPLVSLPAGVLRFILLHCTMLGRIAMSQTCHALRTAALSMPSLWSSISCNMLQLDRRDLPTLEPAGFDVPGWRRLPIFFIPSRHYALWATQSAFLSRASPVGIHLELITDISERFVDMIATHLDHVEKLHLALFDWRPFVWDRPQLQEEDLDTPHPRIYSYADEGLPRDLSLLVSNDYPLFMPSRPFTRSLAMLNHVLREPAPRLKSLSLDMYQFHDIPMRTDLSADLFAGRAPVHLQRCKLRGINWPRLGCPGLAAVTHFDYAPHPAKLTATEVCEILEGLPVLHTLGLSLQDFEQNETDIEKLQQRHGCLVNVGINIDSFRGLRPRPPRERSPPRLYVVDILIAFFALRAVQQFAVRAEIASGRDPDKPSAIIRPQRLELASPWSVAYSSDITVRLSAQTVKLVLQQAATLSGVTVCIMDLDFPTSIDLRPPPPFPALTHLCLVTEWCTDCKDFNPDSPFDMFTGRWSVPALLELRIVCRNQTMSRSDACAKGCVQSLARIEAFVSEHLSFAAPRLQHLLIAGFRRDPNEDFDAAMESLRSLSDIVEVSSECVLNMPAHNITHRSLPREGIIAIFDESPVQTEPQNWDRMARPN
ncbi:hypothetical protein EXIGLDRAFT_835069 [Exidia glandulosa HHB12029]|uniref:F-box domain-containing protein n=1 Tax=Exidia glandulosa HHB12029 TaxID=1314781 RepID=A0A165J5Z5_EXIGL|nr:hypothetical protein EXIGLDRAFT_835069 [Exidia glandulosa HHB12029]